MTQHDDLATLARRFEDDRQHLRTVAQRILGSPDEAEDAVQEAWVRLSRTDTSDVGNLTGWLTTVVSRVCLDMLRSRTSRREDPAELPPETPETTTAGPEHQAEMADAIGPALMLVLDTLNPSERLAFVLHDMFAVPFPEIAEIIGSTPAAARQLASRGRRRVQGGAVPTTEDVARRRAVVDAFLSAARDGEFSALLTVLHPEVDLRADETCVRMGTAAHLHGAEAIATRFDGGAKALRLCLLDGSPGLVWMHRGEAKVVFAFTVAGDQITAIAQIGDPDAIAAMDIEMFPAR